MVEYPVVVLVPGADRTQLRSVFTLLRGWWWTVQRVRDICVANMINIPVFHEALEHCNHARAYYCPAAMHCTKLTRIGHARDFHNRESSLLGT